MGLDRALLAFSILALAASCGGSPEVLRERTTTPVDASGGVALSADGRLTLRFPAGAVSSAEEVTIETRRDLSHPDLVALIYEIGPESLMLQRDAELSITLDSDFDAPSVVVFEGNLPVRVDSTYDPPTRSVATQVRHFSMWSAVGTAVSTAMDAGVADVGPSDIGLPDVGQPDAGHAGDAGDAGPADAGSGPPLVVVTATVPSSSRCASYRWDLEATGGRPPYVWSLESGTLPDGLTLDGRGALVGAARSAGRETFTLRVTDAAGAQRDATFTINIDSDVGGLRWMVMGERRPAAVPTATRAFESRLWVADVCSGVPTATEVSIPGGHPSPSERFPGLPDAHYSLALAPDGRAMVYFAESWGPSRLQMHVVDLRGASAPRAQPLNWPPGVSGPTSMGTLLISDDGRKVAGAGDFALHYLDVNDPARPGTPKRLSVPFGESISVWFSPDSRWLAYWDYDGTLIRDVSQLNIGLGAALETKPGLGWMSPLELLWTPDSRAILTPEFPGDRTDNFGGLYWNEVGAPVPIRVGPSREYQSQSTDLDRASLRFQTRPDGRQVFAIYSDDFREDRLQIYLSDLSGPTPASPVPVLPPTERMASIHAARWSHDGTQLLLGGRRMGDLSSGLFLVDVSGTLPVSLRVVGLPTGLGLREHSRSFGWSSTGDAFAYVVGGPGLSDELYVADRATLSPQRVAQVTGGDILRFQFSPDGRRIAAVVEQGVGHELYFSDLSGSTPGPWARVHPAPATAADALAPPEGGLFGDWTHNAHPGWFWTSDSRSLVFRGAFGTTSIYEMWIANLTQIPIQAQRLSPALPAGGTIYRAWASGDYAKEPALRR